MTPARSPCPRPGFCGGFRCSHIFLQCSGCQRVQSAGGWGRGRRESADTHLSPSGPPHRGHPPAAGRRTLQVSAGFGGVEGVVTVVQEWSSWPPPHPIRLFLCRAAYSPIQTPQGCKGHTRVGGGGCPPHSQVSCPKVGITCSNGLVSPGLGTPGAAGALHWRVSPHLWGPEAPEVTEPSRLVGESSGGEVRKQQLDTRVRQEPPGRPVSGAEWGGQGAEAGLKAQGRRGGGQPGVGCLPGHWLQLLPPLYNGLPSGC